MPSRLIQGLDGLDTCSQFSDSATLHTLTRMGALQKEVYFSRSESNFNNFDTISYGNSSTCCCDAEIKVNYSHRLVLLNWNVFSMRLMSINKCNLNIHSFIRFVYFNLSIDFNNNRNNLINELSHQFYHCHVIFPISICRWICNYEIQFISATHVAASRRETQKTTQR